MLEKEFHIAELIAKHMQGGLNAAEQQELNTWLQDSPVNLSGFEQFSNAAAVQERLHKLRSADENAGWTKTLSKIGNGVNEEMQNVKPLYKIWYKFAAAAILLLSLSAGAWFYFVDNHKMPEYANDVAPGRNSATLTLADGRRIVLSDAAKGKLAEQSGVNISKDAEGKLVYHVVPKVTRNADQTYFNTLSTANGEQYQVVLPDSTKVWLNAATAIKFPSSFAGLKTRTIELVGEAYFEVKKDKQHPFIVKAGTQQVKVLGTHFNINSYAEEKITATTLIEGSVQVSSSKPGPTESIPNGVVLKPGEQALSSNTALAVSQANMENALDWHRGDFAFNDDDFRATMRKIARWYDVDVVFEPSAPEVLLPGGWVSRSKHISAVLTIMELTGKVHFKVEGRRITVTK